MQKIYFNFSSITFAMKSEKLLKLNHINCNVVKTPSQFSSCGCGYSVVINKKDLEMAKYIILNHNILLNDVKELEE